jgi:hypothetical protein
MVSQKKLDANRRNAQKSTGPKTDDGKAASSQNALTHGLTASKFPILPGEDEAAYVQFHAAMSKDLKPKSMMQREIVDDLVQVRWQIRRVPRIEAELFRETHRHEIESHEYLANPRPFDTLKLLSEEFRYEGGGRYANMELYRQRLQRSMHSLLRELRKLREEQGDNEDEDCCSTGVSPVPPPIDQAQDHGQDARGTEEQPEQTACGKNEPTECDNSPAGQALERSDNDALGRAVEQSLKEVMQLDKKLAMFRRMMGR